jgi:hypothetical protein
MNRRERLCGCSHEERRHELVAGEHRGACQHGCGCEAFHTRRRGTSRRFVSPPLERTPSIAVALAAIERARAALHEAEAALRASPGTLQAVPSAPPSRPKASARPPSGKMRGERRILIAVAQHAAGVTREQLTVLTGYKRSSRDTYLQRLRAAGHVDDGDRIRATPAGIASLGRDYEPLPTGAALVSHWRERLSPGELVILDSLLAAFPQPVDRETLSASTGYRRSSRDTYLQRLRARGLVHTMSDGTVAIAVEFSHAAKLTGTGRP